jgi:hypothetical protein
MGWFWKGKGEDGWSLEGVKPPWGPGTSIHAHIRAHMAAGRPGLTEGGVRLPDEKDDGQIKWVAGGLDGAFGHHGGTDESKASAKMLHRAIAVVLDDPSDRKLRLLYEQLAQASALALADHLVEEIVEKQSLNADRLAQLAVWIAKNAPDREAVKLALALLGLLPAANERELLMTLGRHEEFTLYSAVALTNTCGAEADRPLRELAEHVDGWGRIQIVERLAKTEDPAIKRWLVREGYKNSVMYEYVAYTCAVAGGLLRELQQLSVDSALLTGAGDIIVALIAGGPAENMDDYADGAAVVQRYVHHLQGHPKAIAQLTVLGRIRTFLREEADWTARAARGWSTGLRSSLEDKVAELTAAATWTDLVHEGLASDDPGTFGAADLAAREIGLDTWDHHFSRLEKGIDTGWYFVMQTDDTARVERVLALGERLIPLDSLATGPSESHGLGAAWTNHGHLDFILQDLRRFPGKGWRFIQVGLRSPVVRNRNMALRALSAWERDTWPSNAQGLLEQALGLEPNQSVREGIETLLAGKKMEPPFIRMDA